VVEAVVFACSMQNIVDVVDFGKRERNASVCQFVCVKDLSRESGLERIPTDEDGRFVEAPLLLIFGFSSRSLSNTTRSLGTELPSWSFMGLDHLCSKNMHLCICRSVTGFRNEWSNRFDRGWTDGRPRRSWRTAQPVCSRSTSPVARRRFPCPF
jgi:hypothetical protein